MFGNSKTEDDEKEDTMTLGRTNLAIPEKKN